MSRGSYTPPQLSSGGPIPLLNRVTRFLFDHIFLREGRHTVEEGVGASGPGGENPRRVVGGRCEPEEGGRREVRSRGGWQEGGEIQRREVSRGGWQEAGEIQRRVAGGCQEGAEIQRRVVGGC